jgi:MFS transporter, DHA1 family, multidrug resistance protein
MARDTGVDAAAIQPVIALFLIGMGVGQLVAGPMADGWGRRRVLLGGLMVYAAGSLCAALAQGLDLILLSRLLQALGGAAGIVTARVLVHELSPPGRAAERQATLMAIVLVSPTVAPVLGGLIAQWLGWRH